VGYCFGGGEAYPEPGEETWADVDGYDSNLLKVDLGLGAQKLDGWSESFSVTSISGCME
jgi:hypothetical protein